MRYNISTKQSTRFERIFYECLKEMKIPFKHRWIIENKEVDFVIGNYAIEIDGHEQDIEKNGMLINLGYSPIHLHNSEITKENIIKLLNKIK